MKHQLTHFTRFIPAKTIRASLERWMRLSMWGSMMVLFVLNLAIRFNYPPFMQIAHSAFDHLLLAGSFLGQGRINLAKEELSKLNVNTKTNVLGDATNEPSPLSSWQKENEKLNNQLKFWEEVVSSHPEYRDAYLAIAQLGYILNKPEIASDNVRKAEMLDPNGPSIKIFEALTK